MKARLGLRHFTRKQYIKPKHTKLFIGGKWEKSASGNKFTTIDPHTEEIITEVEEAGVEDVGRAVYAARKAFDEGPWRKFSGQQRAECLFKLAHLIDKHREELALLEALNNGKTLTNANMVDVERSIQSYRYFAGWADKVTGDTIPAHGNFFAYIKKIKYILIDISPNKAIVHALLLNYINYSFKSNIKIKTVSILDDYIVYYKCFNSNKINEFLVKTCTYSFYFDSCFK